MGVSLIIDYSNGAEKRFTNLPVQERALDLLDAAKATPPGLAYELTVPDRTDRGGRIFGWLRSIDLVPKPGETAGKWCVWVNARRVSDLHHGFGRDGAEDGQPLHYEDGDRIVFKYIPGRIAP